MFSKMISKIFGIATYAIALAAFAANLPINTPTCPTPSNPLGANQYRCIDTSLIGEQSYCLRESGKFPMHIRGMKNSSAMATVIADGKVSSIKVENFDAPKADHPCHDTAPLKLMEHGDRITIVPNDGGGLSLTILSEKSSPPFSEAKFSLELLPSPTMDTQTFYWSGSKNEVDYFVYLADESHGQLDFEGPSNVQHIEKYIRLEAFKRNASADCAAHRPDVGATSNNLPQVHVWNEGSHDCDITDRELKQHGTGGGGQDYP